MTIEEDKQLSRSDYWDSRYVVSDGENPTHEWFRSFDKLEPFFRNNLFNTRDPTGGADPYILHLGSGDSDVPAQLESRGYKRQLCVDFSPVVVQMMTERHKDNKGIEWQNMDVRNMVGVVDKSVDVAFDKGTLDAMIYGSPWSPPHEVKDNTSQYLKEVHRILKDDGFFLYITFRQPHFMQPLLNAGDLWDLEMQVLSEEGAFDYYGYVITKRK